MKHYDRVWAEVDLDAIAANIENIKKCIKPETKIIAVIKTDGYGHGALPIARILEPDDAVWGYAVATVEEAYALREKGIKKPLLILGYNVDLCIEHYCLARLFLFSKPHHHKKMYKLPFSLWEDCEELSGVFPYQ